MGVIQGRLVDSSGPTALPVPTVGQVVENVTALRALVGSVDLPVVGLVQYSGSTLIGGGEFAWRATAAVDDGGNRFNAGGIGSSGAGWQRLTTYPLDVTHFGATGDGVTDDAAAIRLAIAAGLGLSGNAGGGKLYFPPGTYLCGSSLVVAGTWASGAYPYVSLSLEGDAHPFGADFNAARLVFTDKNNPGLVLQSVRGVGIRFLSIYGPNEWSLVNDQTDFDTLMDDASFQRTPGTPCRDNRYSPHAGLCVDPFASSVAGYNKMAARWASVLGLTSP